MLGPMTMSAGVSGMAGVSGTFGPTAALAQQVQDGLMNPTRTTRLVVDSRDRDRRRYPDPAQYTIELNEPVRDVKSLALLVADVPFVSYLVAPPRSQLVVAVAGGAAPFTATVPTGDYDGPGLARAVARALEGADHCFDATYVPATDNVSVSCRAPFTLSFPASGSVARELGHACGSSIASGAPQRREGPDARHWVDAPFRRDARRSPAVVLYVKVPAACKVNLSVNDAVNDSFAILTPNANALAATAPDAVTKSFNPPIPALTRVDVKFVDRDGAPADFQNHDHRLEFLLTSGRSSKYAPGFDDPRLHS